MAQPFRNVNIGRGYELDKDLEAGLKNAIATNRTMLAMEYLAEITKNQKDELIEIKAKLIELSVEKKVSAAKQTKTTSSAEDAV